MRNMRYGIFLFLLMSAVCLAQEEKAEQDMARAQQECAKCARVLISHLDTSDKRIHDNEKTEAQANWLQHDAKLVKSGKVKERIWFTPFRKNAEYNVVWSLQMDHPERPTSIDAWIWVYEVDTGRKLFQTWHRATYLNTEHPDEQCLVDAVNFLRTRKVSANGVVTFAGQHESQDYFPAPREAR